MINFSNFPKRPIYLRPAAYVFALGIVLPASASISAELTGLGTLGGSFSNPRDISPDGRFVVGHSKIAGDTANHSFLWTSSGGMLDIGSLAGETDSYAHAVSADGTVVVGEAGLRAFRWTASGGMTEIGPGGGVYTNARGVSWDGSIIVGESAGHAFHWATSTGLVALNPAETGTSNAEAVSADGTVIVGSMTPLAGNESAFRWTSALGMVELGTLGGTFSEATAISADGRVVAGRSTLSGGDTYTSHAFRWTTTDGVMRDLGTLGGTYSSVGGISANGAVVVGASTLIGDGSPANASALRAFRWTAVTGMQSVAAWLATSGRPVQGWTLIGANATNQDGTIIVGRGLNPQGNEEAYIARGGSGLISATGFGRTLDHSARATRMGDQLSSLAMHGAHHRNLMDMALVDKKGSCAWISGDWAHYGDLDADGALSEVGACHDFIGGKVRAGLGVGKSYVRQDLALDGDSRLNGEYLTAEVDWKFDAPFIASVTGMYGHWDASLKRGYSNGGSPDYSRGTTDVSSTAFRVRLDWLQAFSFGGIDFSPRIEATYGRTNVDAYTETGGGFPVAYNKQKETSYDVRVGLTGVKPLSERTHLHGTTEIVYGDRKSDQDLSGKVVGLFDFSLPNNRQRDTWLRIGAEIDHRLSPSTVLSTSISAASQGADPDISATFSFKAYF